MKFEYEGKTYKRISPTTKWMDMDGNIVPDDMQKKLSSAYAETGDGPKGLKKPIKHNVHHYSGGNYGHLEKAYPGYVILQKEKFMYAAHNESAEVLNIELDYKLFVDDYGRVTTGGPDIIKIEEALDHAGWSYIVVEDKFVVEIVDNEKKMKE